MNYPFDPQFDLLLEREVAVPVEFVWQAWTKPEMLVQWFTPAPWTTRLCEIDLKPGGKFRTVMASPEGQEFDGVSCYLEVVENQRLVWTSILGPGFRPQDGQGGIAFTAIILLEPIAGGTRYTAHVMHPTDAMRSEHEAMGFHQGWSSALDQLVALHASR